MKFFNNLFHKVNSLIFRYKYARASMPERIALLRPKFYHIGNNVQLYTDKFGTEPYLIKIEDNVCVAADVKFITHDVSCFNMAKYLDVGKDQVDKVGCIVLKDNCFIGAYTILMPNCSVGRNSVIAAGSVVTRHVPDNEVWGGNPAKFIMTTDEYAQRVLINSKKMPWTKVKEIISKDKLIAMRQDFFFKDERGNLS